ncbi:MAG: Hsp20/alpha crystallin family protein [Limnoraphis sp. WC205]|nr:Hsp20/alpha crystallin family protein [Limnoraphis sp. WC205]
MMLAYNPFAEMERMQREFDRMFNTELTTRWTPAIELQETPDSYVLRAFLPGLDSEALNIEAAKKAIAISGKTNRPELDEGHKYIYSEFPAGEFRRVVNLPEAIAHTEVKADYVDGVLTLTMPKAPETVNRVVKVSLNSVEQPQLSEVEQ